MIDHRLLSARLLVLLTLAALPVPLASRATAQDAADWPQFLGPARNGISAETGLLDAWPEEGPPLLWRVEGGQGMAGLAIVGVRAVTLVQRSNAQIVVAMAAGSGDVLWQQEIAPAYHNAMGDGPRATPTIVDDTVYVYTGEGLLAALALDDGSVRWQHNVLAEFDAEEADYGMASSPLVAGDLVIVTVGAPGATVAAYDRRTGKLAWKSGDDEAAGYSSPALLEVGGAPQVVVFAGSAVLGLAPASGRPLWRYPYETDYHCNIATPLAYDGQVFISSGENHGSAMLAVKKNGGEYNVREAWTSLGPSSTIRNEWQTSILADGYLYGFDNVGSAGPVTHLTCVRAATGERVWQELRFGKGNLIAADGKLFLSTIEGELVVARLSPAGYEEIGRRQLLGPTRTAPAVSQARLYLRDDREIVCVDVRQKPQ